MLAQVNAVKLGIMKEEAKRLREIEDSKKRLEEEA